MFLHENALVRTVEGHQTRNLMEQVVYYGRSLGTLLIYVQQRKNDMEVRTCVTCHNVGC